MAGIEAAPAGDGILAPYANARVLIVDDEPSNLELMVQILRRQGLRGARTVSDPFAVMEAVATLDPDLVILDLHMPGLDGYHLLRQLRGAAAGAYLPVLVLTGDRSRDAINRALDLGANDFLAKPLDITETCLRARNLLQMRALYRTLRHHNLDLRRQIGVYERQAATDSPTRLEVSDRVREVLEPGAMTMALQPVCDVVTGAIVGCEALARFPASSVHQPADRWFEDAHSVGLGLDLELAAVSAALELLPAVPPSMFLAINVSPATAMAHDLEGMFPSGATQRIVLELTEHVPIEDYGAVHAALRQLREDGVRVALDDTGAGYAGFRHLLGLSPDVIKLDITLTRDIDTDVSKRALASALLSFARELEVAVIAEGVETQDELDTLARLEVPWVQGFLIGRPQQPEALYALAAARC
jgi:EAL domain-containing protein (putative c-di-GMP-specific phosphodiesterase class I)/DNA-binding response OmpR family regulator